MSKLLTIEVVYALPERQVLVSLVVEPGCTVLEAARRSGIDRQFPGLELAAATLGIFGRRVADPNGTPVRDGDRVEIYRPLLIDPKEFRRARAEEARQELQRARAVKRRG